MTPLFQVFIDVEKRSRVLMQVNLVPRILIVLQMSKELMLDVIAPIRDIVRDVISFILMLNTLNTYKLLKNFKVVLHTVTMDVH